MATDADRAAFIDAARTLVDTPFHHGGRLAGIGLDCIGTPAVAAALRGFEVRDVLAYPMRPNGMLQPILDDRLVKVKLAEKMPGDVLLMAFPKMQPHHLAIFTGPTLIHAYMQARRVVEQAYTDYWARLTVAAYRFPELA